MLLHVAGYLLLVSVSLLRILTVSQKPVLGKVGLNYLGSVRNQVRQADPGSQLQENSHHRNAPNDLGI